MLPSIPRAKHAVEGLTKAAVRVRRTSSRACRSSARPLLKKSPTPSFSLPAKRRFLPAVDRRRWGQDCRLAAKHFRCQMPSHVADGEKRLIISRLDDRGGFGGPAEV